MAKLEREIVIRVIDQPIMHMILSDFTTLISHSVAGLDEGSIAHNFALEMAKKYTTNEDK